MAGEEISVPKLPVGFRFLPTDEELVTYYLINRVYYRPLPAKPIQDIHASEFYGSPPHHLAISSSREREYFFFIQGDDQGEEIRMVEDGRGFWKLSGDETPIYDSDGNIFAFKIYWTYFSGSLRKPKKTHWRMEEYRLPLHCYMDHDFKGEKLVLGRIKRSKGYISWL
eukprot:XP_019081999.1 PREDICTED: protein FEZ-like [Vitis vinifera]